LKIDEFQMNSKLGRLPVFDHAIQQIHAPDHQKLNMNFLALPIL
jgi:hypothetical protein